MYICEAEICQQAEDVHLCNQSLAALSVVVLELIVKRSGVFASSFSRPHNTHQQTAAERVPTCMAATAVVQLQADEAQWLAVWRSPCQM